MTPGVKSVTAFRLRHGRDKAMCLICGANACQNVYGEKAESLVAGVYDRIKVDVPTRLQSVIARGYPVCRMCWKEVRPYYCVINGVSSPACS